MINNLDAAREVSKVVTDICNRLAETTLIVKEKCSAEEYKAYIRATSGIAAALTFEVLEPIYNKHPVLKPAGWDD